jgi:diadenylate cyclase
MTLQIWQTAKPFIEIAILWFMFYRLLEFFEGTRAFQVLKGIIVLILAFLIFQILGLYTINWLITRLFGISVIGLMIIFQPEIRHGLARLGQQHLFAVTLKDEEIIALVKEIATATFRLSQKKIGALIAIERENKLTSYIESGIILDSKVRGELLQSIFNPGSPLHDGGVVIRGEAVAAAVCLFPLTENPHFSKVMGTRHRAAIGLTEHMDAAVVLVSEETGEVSIAFQGRFINIESEEGLIKALRSILIEHK